MEYLIVQIEPNSAFGTPMKGDTLFGQLCWSIRAKFGNRRLQNLLDGYDRNQPFVCVSDAFSSGFLPRPKIPAKLIFSNVTTAGRKNLKLKNLLPIEKFDCPVSDWHRHLVAKSTHDEQYESNLKDRYHRIRTHNSIDRRSNTTSSEGFAPYSMSEDWYFEATKWDIHFIFDSERISKEEILGLMHDIGQFGFGRDATTGMGRFQVNFEASSTPFPKEQKNSNSWLTLAPTAPQQIGIDPQRSWYQPFVRFGQHGNIGATGRFLKKPLLLADTGAVLTLVEGYQSKLFIGQGIGGKNLPISDFMAETVHQGYAPVLGINLSVKDSRLLETEK